MSRARLSALLLALLVGPPARGQDFRKHVVVAQEGHAAEVGRDVLRAGGNAVDAAVATAFALAVTHPAAGNLGGGGFLVAYLADSNEVFTVDFREQAPVAADERMYLDAEGKLLPKHRAGPRAAGVPGTVRGLALAHQRSGVRPWAEVVAPAVRLAREGFPVSGPLARSLNAQLFREAVAADVPEDLGPQADRLADFPASVAAFRKPGGSRWEEGDRLVQPDLAATLRRIAERGPDEFYKGETARLIVAAMESGGGLITADDLARYEAKLRLPVTTTYRGHEIYGVGPPASGGPLVVLMLNVLEPFDLRSAGRDDPRTVHRIAEAMRRAYFVRATQIADPDFVRTDAERITSKPYAAKLAATITGRATPSRELADFPILDAEGADTTHLSVLDGAGNAVALTYTLEEGYGSKAVVAGAGFLLNNEMGDFNLIPDRTDTAGRIGTRANRIAPRKRMLSSQAPTLVLKDGRVRVVTGSPGGRTIPNTVLWVLLGVLEFGLEPGEAVAAPRTHHAWFPDRLILEGDRWPEATRAALEQRGHRVGRTAIQGDAHTIVVTPDGRIHGVPDPRRRTGRAAGD